MCETMSSDTDMLFLRHREAPIISPRKDNAFHRDSCLINSHIDPTIIKGRRDTYLDARASKTRHDSPGKDSQKTHILRDNGVVNSKKESPLCDTTCASEKMSEVGSKSSDSPQVLPEDIRENGSPPGLPRQASLENISLKENKVTVQPNPADPDIPAVCHSQSDKRAAHQSVSSDNEPLLQSSDDESLTSASFCPSQDPVGSTSLLRDSLNAERPSCKDSVRPGDIQGNPHHPPAREHGHVKASKEDVSHRGVPATIAITEYFTGVIGAVQAVLFLLVSPCSIYS